MPVLSASARDAFPREPGILLRLRTDDQPRALCALDLAAARVRIRRMPAGDEAHPGIWARRYWMPDAKVRASAPPSPTRSR